MTFEPWVNDTPGVASIDPNGDIVVGVPTFSMTSVRLCSPTQTAPNCNESSVVTIDGEYVVNSDGSVTFTPAPGFTGVATVPVTYQISTTTSVVDHGGQPSTVTSTTSAVLHPVVVSHSPPAAQDDLGSAEFGQSVILQPWTNDVPLSGSTIGTVSFINDGFVHTSVALCGPNESAPMCTASVVTTVDGRYVVNPDGSVTFTPATGFSGTVTEPPHYQITNVFRITNSDGSTTLVESETVSARLIPTIGHPTPSTVTTTPPPEVSPPVIPTIGHPTPSTTVTLPRSGVESQGLAIFAAALLALGVLLVMTRRLASRI
jgi:CshA-type fibril repeat protein